MKRSWAFGHTRISAKLKSGAFTNMYFFLPLFKPESIGSNTPAIPPAWLLSSVRFFFSHARPKKE